ncbi:MAG: IS1634 family transposase [Clostridiales bacterium]|nr:IS1634 family transposase [Clostridiales bacterium]
MARIERKRNKGNDYWYLVESYRNEKKQPRSRVIEYYGNTDSFVARLNDAIKEGSSTSVVAVRSYEHGTMFALHRMAEKLGLTGILDSAFPKRTRKKISRTTAFVACAFHRACHPGSKKAFADWAVDTTMNRLLPIPEIHDMTSQVFWDMMDDISQDQIDKACDALSAALIQRYRPDMGRLALDYTNYYTFIDSFNERSALAKRGHNKQKRNDLRQFSLAIVTTREPSFPLFSFVYEGNINDKGAFEKYWDVLSARIKPFRPLEDTTLIFDGGSVDKDNLERIKSHYICAFSLSSAKDLYDIPLSEYGTASAGAAEILCYRKFQEVWGVKRVCILTHSDELYKNERLQLRKDIDSLFEKAKEINKRLESPRCRIKRTEEGILAELPIPKKYGAIVTKSTDGSSSITLAEHEDEFEKHCCQHFGKSLIITDRNDWTTEQILKAYREQEAIERIFRLSKGDHCAVRPTHHFTDDKIRAHMFCCLLAVNLALALQRELDLKGLKMSVDEILDRLATIRSCIVTTSTPRLTSSRSIQTDTVLEQIEDPVTQSLWDAVQKI